MKKAIKPIIIIGGIIVVIAAALTVMRGAAARRNSRAMAAAFEEVMAYEEAYIGDITEIVTATGIVRLQDEQSVYSTAAGKISSVLVEQGDKVSAGQIIVEYDTADKRKTLEKQISQTEINLSSQNLTLQGMVAPASRDTVKQLQNSVDSAVNGLENAKDSVDSANSSVYNAENSVKTAENSVRTAENGLFGAENTLYNANEAYKGTQIKIADQQTVIQNAEDSLAKAEQSLSDSEALLAVGGISRADCDKAADAVTTAKNTLTNAQNALRDLERQLEANQVSIDNAVHGVESAKQDIENAKRGVESALQSVESANRGVDTANRGVATAQKSLNNARTNLAEANITLKNETDRLNYEKQLNQIKSTEIDLADLKRQLNETVDSDLSPIDGIVTAVSVAKGRSVDSNTVLVTVADFNKLIVKSNISEYDIPKLQLGQTVSMTSDGLGERVYTGTITKIGDSAVSQGSGTNAESVVQVEIAVDQIDGIIKPGFSLDLEITSGHAAEAVIIPVSSVKKDADGARYVFKVENGKLVKAAITLGIVSDMRAQAVTGVSAGDNIIAIPTDDMYDGMPYSPDAIDLTGRASGGQNNFPGAAMFGR